jgi:N-acetylmuramoyl-L-alanine amidase
MRWSKQRTAKAGLAVAAVALCALGISADTAEHQLTVYTAQSTYSLPVLDREGKAFIDVASLLSPLGASQLHAKGKEWRLELNKAELRLTEGKEKAFIRGYQADLSGKVLVEAGHVLVPMDAALPLLSQLLKTAVDFHQPSRRIFVGNVFTRFHAELKNGDQPSLVLTFSQPIKRLDSNHEEDRGALFTHTNKTTLTFRKDPLVSDVNKQQFGDGPIQSLLFTEENGTASILVTGNEHLQVLRSEDGKTITLQPQVPAAAATPAPNPQVPAAAATPAPNPQAPPASAEGQRHTQEFFVMIDPGHGGYDKGASFGGKLSEKEVTLKLARELRKELEERGIAARLLRDSDIDVALERRAEITNEQHAGIYVALHAGRPGHGVRVYSPLLADTQPALAGRFLPWESAQSGALNRSKTAANAVATELRKKGLAVASLGMPVRPLNNIVAPAIAVELAPENSDPQSMENQKRHNAVASAIASGIAQVRGQMGIRP